MHVIFNHMHDFFTPCITYHRTHPCWINLDSFGYGAAKARWIRNAFDSFNFSFILAGKGEYRTATQRYAVNAPCVITQWPGAHVAYGPDTEWEEFYLIYPAKALARLQHLGYARKSQPLWHIQDPTPLRARIMEMARCREQISAPGGIDRLDRMAEQLIFESWLQKPPHAPSAAERAIREIQSILQRHFLEKHDLNELARKRGLSGPTFRRRWAQWVGPPPLEYLTRIRLQEACRLLVESDLTVNEIADQLNFQQPDYFSRKFRQWIGCTATAFRARHGELSAPADCGDPRRPVARPP